MLCGSSCARTPIRAIRCRDDGTRRGEVKRREYAFVVHCHYVLSRPPRLLLPAAAAVSRFNFIVGLTDGAELEPPFSTPRVCLCLPFSRFLFFLARRNRIVSCNKSEPPPIQLLTSRRSRRETLSSHGGVFRRRNGSTNAEKGEKFR